VSVDLQPASVTSTGALFSWAMQHRFAMHQRGSPQEFVRIAIILANPTRRRFFKPAFASVVQVQETIKTDTVSLPFTVAPRDRP
jgi:hypothetical protein